MARAIYTAHTEGVVAVAANTTKTVFGIKADSSQAIDLLGFSFSYDGVTAADKSVLAELMYITWASNAPGTNSTAVTVAQASGRAIAETFAVGKNWTTEPTTYAASTFQEIVEADPYKFYFKYDWPLGDSPDSAVAEGFALRITNPTGNASVNVRAWAKWARL